MPVDIRVTGQNPFLSLTVAANRQSYFTQIVAALEKDAQQKNQKLPQTRATVQRATEEQFGAGVMTRTFVTPVFNTIVGSIFTPENIETLTKQQPTAAAADIPQILARQKTMLEALPGERFLPSLLALKKNADQFDNANNRRPIEKLRQDNHDHYLMLGKAVLEKSTPVRQSIEREHGGILKLAECLPASVRDRTALSIARNFFPPINQKATETLKQLPPRDAKAIQTYVEASTRCDSALADLRSKSAVCISMTWQGKQTTPDGEAHLRGLQSNLENYRSAVQAEKAAWQSLRQPQSKTEPEPTSRIGQFLFGKTR